MRQTAEEKKDLELDAAKQHKPMVKMVKCAEDDPKCAPEEALDYDEEMTYAFPEVNPGARPLGGRILVQLKRIRATKKGSPIIMPGSYVEAEKYQNMVGKVIAIGPLAFKKRDSMEPWPEGSWCEIGDYLRVPKWGGDRWEVPFHDGLVSFVVMNDHEIIAAITGNPLEMKAYY
jgi:co-chaperonin GroES (HSP10)